MTYIIGSILWVIVGMAIGVYLCTLSVSVLVAKGHKIQGQPIEDVLKRLGEKILHKSE